MFSSKKAMIVAWVTTVVVILGIFLWANGEYATVQAEKARMKPPAVKAKSTQDDFVVAKASGATSDETTVIVDDGAVDEEMVDDNPCGGLPPEEEADDDSVEEFAADDKAGLLESDTDALEGDADTLVNWKLYSADVTLDPSLKPIAILMTDMGLNAGRTRDAIDQLPKEVSIGISPYSHEIERWSPIVLDNGNEFLLMLPMEPMRYPLHDPGPLGMLIGASSADNIKRLDTILGSITGYIGMVNHMGSRMTADEPSLTPILQHLKDRGLMFVDSRTTAKSIAADVADTLGLPYAVNSRYIDNEASEDAILKQLSALEARATKRGSALGIARLSTLSVDTINAWAETLQSRGFQLVPVSAIVKE